MGYSLRGRKQSDTVEQLDKKNGTPEWGVDKPLGREILHVQGANCKLQSLLLNVNLNQTMPLAFTRQQPIQCLSSVSVASTLPRALQRQRLLIPQRSFSISDIINIQARCSRWDHKESDTTEWPHSKALWLCAES